MLYNIEMIVPLLCKCSVILYIALVGLGILLSPGTSLLGTLKGIFLTAVPLPSVTSRPDAELHQQLIPPWTSHPSVVISLKQAADTHSWFGNKKMLTITCAQLDVPEPTTRQKLTGPRQWGVVKAVRGFFPPKEVELWIKFTRGWFSSFISCLKVQ